MAQSVEVAPPSEHRLQRQLRLRDLVLTQILCVVGSGWVGVAAGLGRAETVMWAFAMLVFYLPMAASVIALNREMPLEGGLYVWAHRAFGDFGGFLTAWNLWVYGIFVTAAIIYAIPTEISYLIGPSAARLPENHLATFAIITAFTVALTLATLRGLELGKWIHNIGGIAIMTVFGGLIVLPIWGLLHHMPIHWQPFSVQIPPRNMRSLALFGQMLFGALCGLEYIAMLAGESKNPARSIGQSVWIASPIICLMFILGTSSVLAFAQPGHIDFIAPIPQTMRLSLGSTGIGNWMAITVILLLQLRLLGITSYLFTGITRMPMVVGWDRMIPQWFTRLHPRWRTPSNSILCSGILIFLLIMIASTGVHVQEAFQLLQNVCLAHYELTYLVMFAIPIAGTVALRRKLPRWLKWISAVGFCATLFSLSICAYPFVNVVNPREYAVKILGAVVLSNLAASCYFLIRSRFGPVASNTDTSATSGPSGRSSA